MTARRIIGLIPARGGSKSIIKKNLATLCGQPLIRYTIDTAMCALGAESVVVTSDDPNILTISRQLNAQTIKRPDALATDKASSDTVVRHAIDVLKLTKSTVIALLQPTSPLRTARHLSDALALMREHNYAPLISVNALPGKYHKLLVEQRGCMVSAIKEEFTCNRRQDAPSFFQENGAIYLFTVDDFCKGHDSIPRTGTVPYIMHEHNSIDIDNAADLQHAEEILTHEPS